MAVLPLLFTGGRMAMQALPLITGGLGAIEGAKEGGLLGAVTGGGLGYLTGGLGKGALKGVSGKVGKAAYQNLPGLAAKTVDIGGKTIAPLAVLGKLSPMQLGKLGAASVGLGAAGLAAPIAGRLAGQIGGGVSSAAGGGLQQLRQTGAGLVGTPRPGEVDYSGSGLPPGTGQYGGIEPYGSPTDILLGGGLAQRLQFAKDVEATRDAMRLLNPEIFKAAEARSKTEFERQMAAAGIRQNIATRAAMLQAAQQAGLGMGMTAAQQAGGALTSQYQYQ
jgi:hypothetical protein